MAGTVERGRRDNYLFRLVAERGPPGAASYDDEKQGLSPDFLTDMVGAAHEAFAAAGLRPPSPVTPLGATPPAYGAFNAQEVVVPNSFCEAVTY